jgi:hypothetical protein
LFRQIWFKPVLFLSQNAGNVKRAAPEDPPAIAADLSTDISTNSHFAPEDPPAAAANLITDIDTNPP